MLSFATVCACVSVVSALEVAPKQGLVSRRQLGFATGVAAASVALPSFAADGSNQCRYYLFLN